MSSKDEVLRFSTKIEELVQSKRIPYMEAIILYCENSQLEVEVAAKLLSTSIKAKIKMEAEELNFLEKTVNNRLPI